MDAKKPEKTNVLLYLSPGEVEALTQTILENWDAMLTAATAKKKDKSIANLVAPLIKNTKDRTGAPDIALFGRMLADQPELGLDAACQVAHAISTHRVTMEMDYYTAVDDLLQDEEAGAGMVGFTGFNSACFYRYARIDWKQLTKNLSNNLPLAQRTVAGFLHAALLAIPTGKQNSFAAHNPTSFALAVVRKDGQGWSLANAFETPVRPGRDTGLIRPSVKAFDDYWHRLCQLYGTDQFLITAALALDNVDVLEHCKDALVPNLSTWVESIVNKLPQE